MGEAVAPAGQASAAAAAAETLDLDEGQHQLTLEQKQHAASILAFTSYPVLAEMVLSENSIIESAAAPANASDAAEGTIRDNTSNVPYSKETWKGD